MDIKHALSAYGDDMCLDFDVREKDNIQVTMSDSEGNLFHYEIPLAEWKSAVTKVVRRIKYGGVHSGTNNFKHIMEKFCDWMYEYEN